MLGRWLRGLALSSSCVQGYESGWRRAIVRDHDLSMPDAWPPVTTVMGASAAVARMLDASPTMLSPQRPRGGDPRDSAHD